MMEPKLVIFYEEDANAQQMFVCAENQVAFEVTTSNKVLDGLIHLMAMYYVFDVQYPQFCKATLYFMQDILMGKPDKHSKRPTRYTTFIQSNDFI